MIEVLRKFFARNHPSEATMRFAGQGVIMTTATAVAFAALSSTVLAQGVATPAGGVSPNPRSRSRAAHPTVPIAVPAEIVAKVPAGTTRAEAEKLFAQAGCTIVRPIPYSKVHYLLTIDPVGTKALRSRKTLEFSPVSDGVNVAVAKLRSTSGVLADPNFARPFARQTGSTVTGTFTPNDPYFVGSGGVAALQAWDMNMINMPQAWAIQTGTRPVYVGVMDSGIDPTNPDLIDHLAGGLNFSDDQLDAAGNINTAYQGDTVGHGTHIAGTIAAKTNNSTGVVGIAGLNTGGVDVRLYQLRVGGAAGVDEAAELAALAFVDISTTPSIDVINMSFGGFGFSQVEEDAIENVMRSSRLPHPVILIAAAGNSLTDLPVYPSSYPGVIRVSAVGPSKTLASYSNFGDSVAIAAPGGDGFGGTPSDVWSTWPVALGSLFGPNASTYYGISGTSMATPHVVGVAALLIAGGVPAQPAIIKRALQTTATQLNEAPNFAGGNLYGAGLLNAFAAVRKYTIPSVTIEGGPDRGSSIFRSSAAVLDILLADKLKQAITAGTATVTAEVRLATTPDTVVQTIPITASMIPSATAGDTFDTVKTISLKPAASLGDGRYKLFLKTTYQSGAVTITDTAQQFFEITSQQQPLGLTLFSVPYQPDTTLSGIPPEQQVVGLSSGFALKRFDPLNIDGVDGSGYFTYQPGNQPIDNVVARFNNLLHSVDPLHKTDRALVPLSYVVSNPPSTAAGANNSAVSLAPIGVGFWLNLGETRTLDTTGTAATDSVAIPLFGLEDDLGNARSGNGWNLIGAPFPFPVNWSAVTIRQTTPIGTKEYSLTDAINANIITSGLIGYNAQTADYIFNVAPAGQLIPFSGYWVRALKDCTLVVPPSRSQQSLSSRAASLGSQIPSGGGWRIRLTETVAGDQDGQNYLGQTRGASEGEDKFDIAKPPANPSHAYMRFLTTDAKGRKTPLAFDMRPLESGKRQEEWSVAVGTTKGDSDVTLAWGGLNSVPSRAKLTLKDTVTGATVVMNSRSSYTFHNKEAGATRLFTVTMTQQNSAGPLQILNVRAVNTGGRGVQSGVNVQFTTSQDAEVQATIQTLAGTVVNTLTGATRATAQSGMTLRWDGQTRGGSHVAPGPYILEITARTDSGETTTIKRPIAYLH